MQRRAIDILEDSTIDEVARRPVTSLLSRRLEQLAPLLLRQTGVGPALTFVPLLLALLGASVIAAPGLITVLLLRGSDGNDRRRPQGGDRREPEHTSRDTHVHLLRT